MFAKALVVDWGVGQERHTVAAVHCAGPKWCWPVEGVFHGANFAVMFEHSASRFNLFAFRIFCVACLSLAQFVLCGTVGLAGLYAQDLDGELGKERLFTHRIDGGLTLHTRGMGANLQLGKYAGISKIRTLTIEWVSIKSEKEIKSYNPVYDQGKSYVYGKVNAFYAVRIGLGKRHINTRKMRNGAVALGWRYAFGPVIGLVKPVYLEIGYPSIPYDYVVSERYDPDKHGIENIYGRSSGLNGLLEMGVHPGGFGSVALDFEYGGRREMLRMISIGANLDFYPVAAPIMADRFEQNSRLFFTLFAQWNMGRQRELGGS